LVIVEPRRLTNRVKGAVIEVTGWSPNQTDLDDAQTLADHASMPVAVLFQVPMQPLWGHEEDDLIAHTFEQFLTTGDPSWPLLFPMVKSVRAAMDALVEAEVADRFVVTGASKRGWTTWLSAAMGDARVIGIAPRVFDNLDFVKQLAQQKSYWGTYSPMINDYTERGLQDVLGTDQGKRLIQMVDPLSHLGAISVPVLSITGTNDPYWTVDSTSLYWEKVSAVKWALAVPNSGHVLTNKEWWLETLGSFAIECSMNTIRNRYSTSVKDELFSIHLPRSVSSYRVWTAHSDDLHFEDKKWSGADPVKVAISAGPRVIKVETKRGDKNTALLVELAFQDGVRLTTPVHLVRKK
jgi:PhoPQ-activated pathogenicity-related protein